MIGMLKERKEVKHKEERKRERERACSDKYTSIKF